MHQCWQMDRSDQQGWMDVSDMKGWMDVSVNGDGWMYQLAKTDE